MYSTAKIQGLKKAVPKGDKKRKKAATVEIAKLEEELKVMLEVPEDIATEENDVSSAAQEQLSVVCLDEKQEVGVETGSKKKSKAQKRKVI